MSATAQEAAPAFIIHEQAVLACALQDEATVEEMGPLLPAHFSTALHEAIWLACLELRGAGVPLSVATVEAKVTALLALNDELRAVAQSYVGRVIDTYPVPVGADYHAERVRSYARLRQVAEKARVIVALAEADDLRALTEAEALGREAQAGAAALRTRTNAAVVTATLDLLDERLAGKRAPALHAGLPILDALGALQPKRLVILAARPAVGKSLLSYQAAQHAAKAGDRGLFVSLEMEGEEMMVRQFSHESHIPPRLLDAPHLMSDEWQTLTDTARDITPRPLDVLDSYASGELTLDAILAVARRLKATRGLDFLVLDYLQLLPMPNVERVSEVHALAAITKRLKAAARHLDLCILALSQLNRAGDGERPTLKHLRGSGALEQDADTAFLLWPDTERGDEEGWRQGQRYLTLEAKKNRHGPTRSASLCFNPATMTMSELEGTR